MKQTLIFSPQEAVELLAIAIYEAHGVRVKDIEFTIEQSYDFADRATGIYRLTEIKAWRDENGTETETD